MSDKFTGFHFPCMRICIEETQGLIRYLESHLDRFTGLEEDLLETFKFLVRTLYARFHIADIHLHHFGTRD